MTSWYTNKIANLPLRSSLLVLIVGLVASMVAIACVGNPWATPTPPPSPTPLPTMQSLLVIPELAQGAGGRDASGKFISATRGARIAIVSDAEGKLTVSIPMALPRGTGLASFSDSASGVVLTDSSLVIPFDNHANGASARLLAKLKPMVGTGTSAEAAIETLEIETAEVQGNLLQPDPTMGKVSFQLKGELKSLPPGAEIRTTLTKSPNLAAATAITQAAARIQNKITEIAFVAEVATTRLESSKDIGSQTVTLSVGREWADRVGVSNVAVASVAGNSAELLLTRLVRYTPDNKAIFMAHSQRGASTFALAALERPAPTPAPAAVFYRLIAENDPPGSGSVQVDPPSPNSRYLQGTRVVLRAKANLTHKFYRWEGDAGGPSEVIEVLMDSDRTATAVFAPLDFELSAVSVPPYGGTIRFSPYLNSYEYGTRVTATAEPAPGFKFVDWTGDAYTSANPVSLVMDRSKDITAHFAAIQFSFTTSVNPGGSGTVTPQFGSGELNSSVTLKATPAAGYVFSFWTGDISGAENPATLALDQNKNVVANFAPAKYALTTEAQPSIGGTVNPGGSYNYGAGATLKAQPNPDYNFAGWGGDVSGNENPKLINITKDTNAVARFEIKRYTLNVTISPNWGGSVSPSERGVYPTGTMVFLSATPSPNYIFVSWSGDFTGVAPFIDVRMTRDISLTANFRYVPPPPPPPPPSPTATPRP